MRLYWKRTWCSIALIPAKQSIANCRKNNTQKSYLSFLPHIIYVSLSYVNDTLIICLLRIYFRFFCQCNLFIFFVFISCQGNLLQSENMTFLISTLWPTLNLYFLITYVSTFLKQFYYLFFFSLMIEKL